VRLKHKPTPRLQKRVKALLKERKVLLSQCDELCRDLRAVEIRLAYVEGQRDLLAEGRESL
jgi:rRNA-processing protein FCF1